MPPCLLCLTYGHFSHNHDCSHTHHFDPRLLSYQNCENSFLFISHPIKAGLLQQHKEAKTDPFKQSQQELLLSCAYNFPSAISGLSHTLSFRSFIRLLPGCKEQLFLLYWVKNRNRRVTIGQHKGNYRTDSLVNGRGRGGGWLSYVLVKALSWTQYNLPNIYKMKSFLKTPYVQHLT